MKLQRKVDRIVVRALALSRASLQRDLRRIYGRGGLESGNDVAVVTRQVERASEGKDTGSGRDLGARHA